MIGHRPPPPPMHWNEYVIGSGIPVREQHYLTLDQEGEWRPTILMTAEEERAQELEANGLQE